MLSAGQVVGHGQVMKAHHEDLYTMYRNECLLTIKPSAVAATGYSVIQVLYFLNAYLDLNNFVKVIVTA